MLSINRYYKTKINGQVDYVLANDSIEIPNSLETGLEVSPEGNVDIDIDTPLSGNKLNVVLGRYVGYSSSEDQDVYEVTCVGGSKFLTDYDACNDDLFGGNIDEFAKTILSNQNRAFVNSSNNLFANPMQVASVFPTKDGYNGSEDAEEDNNSVSCFQVTMTTGTSFITNNSGKTDLDDNWC